ncbi:hypothetical protein RUND412_003460 [Rhizina undulata]
MEKRPNTAPAVPGGDTRSAMLTEEERERINRRARTEFQTPDIIEIAAANLFTRVRTLLADRPAVRKDGRPITDTASSSGEASSSYFAEAEESEVTQVVYKNGSERTPQYPMAIVSKPWEFSSSSSSLRSIGRIPVQSVSARHSVPASTFIQRSPLPARYPHYLHSSDPSRSASNRALGLMEPSPDASRVGTVGARSENGVASSSSFIEEFENDGNGNDALDLDKVRNKILSGLGSERDTPNTTIVSIDQDSSSGPNFPLTPDLFPKPLYLDSPSRRSMETPANTVATPHPLIGIIPPTPFTSPSDSSGKERTPDEDEESKITYQPRSVVAHTGASSPQNPRIRSGHGGTISTGAESLATVNKGTMTSFNYEDYAVEGYGELGASRGITPPTVTPPQRPDAPCAQNTEDVCTYTEVLDQDGHPVAMPGNPTSSTEHAALSSYADSDSPKAFDSRTLRQEFVLQEESEDIKTPDDFGINILRRQKSRRSQSRKSSSSREKMEIPADHTLLPLSSRSFTKMINDLEEMLNQALELAGRAVADSVPVREQRDASVKEETSRVSLQGSSVYGGATSVMAVTAPQSFMEANNEPEQDALEKDSISSIHSETVGKLNRLSSQAVYKGKGEAVNVKVDDESSRPDERSGRSRYSSAGDTLSRRSRNQKMPVENFSDEDYTGRTRKSIHSTIASVKSSGYTNGTGARQERYRAEMGSAGEIVLVKIPPRTQGTNDGGRSEKQENKPSRYTGGWEWSLAKKRFSAGISCAIVGLIGWIVGIYFGEGETIRQALDIGGTTGASGNFMFLIGLAIPTLFFWPLPLLHGRKPYILVSISLLLPLQLPQALSLPPYTTRGSQAGTQSMLPYSICFLVFRSISGFVLGFATMNALSTIIDLFGPDTGACCRGGVVFNNRYPIEGQNQFRSVPGGEAGVRIGIWLGIWTWAFVCFPGIGYLFAKIIISRSSPSWGFWSVAILGGVLLLLVVVAPEVRPPWKRARVVHARRYARGRREEVVIERGEINMVVFGSSPEWWWEEVWAGVVLVWRMGTQVGFVMLAVYVGWAFGELVMVARLLAQLISQQYLFKPVDLGLSILALPIGALLSIPVQLSTFYIHNFRHNHHSRQSPNNSILYPHRHQGQHPHRPALYLSTLLLPLSSIALTISATGPPTPFMLPVFFAALTTFAGTLAIAECHLLLFDNFDVSDLPELMSFRSGSVSRGSGNGPHGTQRPASLALAVGAADGFTTCHPTISAGVAMFHFLAFIFAAGAIGWNVYVREDMKTRQGLGIYSGVTVAVTVAFVAFVGRWWKVRVLEVFDSADGDGREERGDMGREEREDTGGVEDGSREEGSRGSMSVRVCRVSVLQRGDWTRWSEVNGLEYWRDEEEEVGAWRS